MTIINQSSLNFAIRRIRRGLKKSRSMVGPPRWWLRRKNGNARRSAKVILLSSSPRRHCGVRGLRLSVSQCVCATSNYEFSIGYECPIGTDEKSATELWRTRLALQSERRRGFCQCRYDYRSRFKAPAFRHGDISRRFILYIVYFGTGSVWIFTASL
jgi:hypothetical protein